MPEKGLSGRRSENCNSKNEKKNDTRCAAFALFEDTAVGRPTFYNEATVSKERFLSEVSNASFAAAAEKTKATGRPSILRPVRRPGGHPGGVRPALLRRRLVILSMALSRAESVFGCFAGCDGDDVDRRKLRNIYSWRYQTLWPDKGER